MDVESHSDGAEGGSLSGGGPARWGLGTRGWGGDEEQGLQAINATIGPRSSHPGVEPKDSSAQTRHHFRAPHHQGVGSQKRRLATNLTVEGTGGLQHEPAVGRSRGLTTRSQPFRSTTSTPPKLAIARFSTATASSWRLD